MAWIKKCPQQIFGEKVALIQRKKRAKKTTTGTPKKKRAPSVYNLFMKDCIPIMKKHNPDIPHTEVFTACAKEYQKRKKE